MAQVRHEYYAGEVYAMAGGTPEHAAIAAAVTAALGRQLVGKAYRVYSSDLLTSCSRPHKRREPEAWIAASYLRARTCVRCARD